MTLNAMQPECNSVEELALGLLAPISAGDVVSWIDLSTVEDGWVPAAADAARASHRVLIGVGWPGRDAGELLDALSLTVHSDERGLQDRRTVYVADLEEAVRELNVAIGRAPIAAATTGQLLRVGRSTTVHDGLVVESFAYSTLQGGPEYARWLKSADYRSKPEKGEPVDVCRTDDRLFITLDRPDRHNALNAAMRDALVDALTVAWVDSTITSVTLQGRGASFSSGGDLTEFGSATDPASAHLIRTQHRPAEQISELATRLGDRCLAVVHGAVMGAGLELAAFAGRIIAHSESRFMLPELSMGLLPGAGGTVSVPRRIGRWRAAWMIFSGEIIDAETAFEWGLVDAVTSESGSGQLVQ
ncbi:enoyl-CoA hydratase/isomerase family protein [Rhodococcus erythropolis]|uniref:enoyl-CoA hydratase/isomerase family protein n=1 Tax=Rhodococcus erythropolis TaxID=1833 RepID=UPI00366E9F45